MLEKGIFPWRFFRKLFCFPHTTIGNARYYFFALEVQFMFMIMLIVGLFLSFFDFGVFYIVKFNDVVLNACDHNTIQ